MAAVNCDFTVPSHLTNKTLSSDSSVDVTRVIGTSPCVPYVGGG